MVTFFVNYPVWWIFVILNTFYDTGVLSQFTFIDTAVTWDQAQTECSNIGLELAVLDTAEKLDVAFQQIYEKYGPTFTLSERFWIGLRWNTDNMTFKWHNNNNDLNNELPWKPNSLEPNCMENTTCPTTDTQNQNCVFIGYSTELDTRTQNCDKLYLVICYQEKTIESSLIETTAMTTLDKTKSPLATSVQSETTITVSTFAETDGSSKSISTYTEASEKAIESSLIETTAMTTLDKTKSSLATSVQTETTITVSTSLTTFAETDGSSKSISTYTEASGIPITGRTTPLTTKFRAIVSCPADTDSICMCEIVKNVSVSQKYLNVGSILRIDKKKTSAFIRKHRSASDGRFSASVMGYTGTAVLVSVALLLVCADFTPTKRRPNNYPMISHASTIMLYLFGFLFLI